MFTKFLKKCSEINVPKEMVTDAVVEYPYGAYSETRSSIYRYSFLLTNRKIFGQLDEIPTNPFDDFTLAKKEVEALGYNYLLDQIILNKYELSQEEKNDLRPDEFSEHFAKYFQHCHISPFTTKEVQETNKEVYEAYQQILMIIQGIQSWLEDEKLRILVEEDLTRGHVIYNTIYHSITAFCMISLKCDQVGRYNIVYNLDPRINEMISPSYASLLIRKIYEKTKGAPEAFVTFNCLFMDCLSGLESYEGKGSSDFCHIYKTPLYIS